MGLTPHARLGFNMFDIAIKRLFWKELRTQWHIWTSLLVGVLLLQMLVLFRHLELGSAYPFTVGLVLTVCYAVTCGAILFAGEREEQTDTLLQQLPLTPGRLIAGKLLFLLLSLAAFALAMCGLTLLVSAWAGKRFLFSRQLWSDQLDLTASYTFAIVGLVAWSLFYSLLLERVMSVLAASVATYLVVAAIVGNVLPGPFEMWVMGIALFVGLADIRLTKRWLSGRSVVPVFEGSRAATGRRSRWWLRSLTWAATRTPVASRTFAVLLWRELRSAIPFALVWSLLGLLVVISLNREARVWTNANWLLLTPLLCGVMTCTGDNRRQTFRFLTDRGLHPAMVWLTKHCVWLLLAISLIGMFGGFGLVNFAQVPTVASGNRVEAGILSLVQAETRIPGYDNAAYFAGESTWRAVSFTVLLGLGLYVVGHLCSLWIRRVVVALCVASVAGIGLFMWTSATTKLDIPPLLSTGPLVLAGVAASLLSVGGWLRETSTWRRKLAQAAWVVIPLLIVGSSALAYRATQIPIVWPEFGNPASVLSEIESSDSAWSNDWRQTFSDLRNSFMEVEAFRRRRYQRRFGIELPREELHEDFPGEGDEMYGGFSMGMPGDEAMMSGGLDTDRKLALPDDIVLDPEEDLRGPVVASTIWDTLLEEGLRGKEVVDRLLSLSEKVEPFLQSGNLSAGAPRIGLSTMAGADLPIRAMGQVLVEAADQYRQQGDLDQAWRVLQAGLTLTAYLPHQVFDPRSLQACWDTRALILQEVHAWAADPQQTIERLRQAEQSFAGAGVSRVPNARSMWWHRYLAYHQAITDPDSRTGVILHDSLSPGSPLWFVSGERPRLDRLIGVITASLLDPRPGSVSFSPFGWNDLNDQITAAEIDRWVSTTPELPFAFYGDNQLDIQPVLAAEAVTPLVLRLQIDRLEHGAFPASLEQLRDESNTESPRDPTTGQFFGYAPQGVDGPVVVAAGPLNSDEFLIPPGTPLLWSPGLPFQPSSDDLYQPQGFSVPETDRQRLKDAAARLREAAADQDETSRQERSAQLMYFRVNSAPW